MHCRFTECSAKLNKFNLGAAIFLGAVMFASYCDKIPHLKMPQYSTCTHTRESALYNVHVLYELRSMLKQDFNLRVPILSLANWRSIPCVKRPHFFVFYRKTMSHGKVFKANFPFGIKSSTQMTSRFEPLAGTSRRKRQMWTKFVVTVTFP